MPLSVPTLCIYNTLAVADGPILPMDSIADVNYTPSQKPRQPVPGDEDYEDGMTIIYRLGGSQCDNSPRCPIVSVVCSCDSRPSQPETHTPVDDTDETLEQDGRENCTPVLLQSHQPLI